MTLFQLLRLKSLQKLGIFKKFQSTLKVVSCMNIFVDEILGKIRNLDFCLMILSTPCTSYIHFVEDIDSFEVKKVF